MSVETVWSESPPSWALPVTVAGGLVLVREASVLAYIGPVCAYPTGFFFHLTVIVNQERAGDHAIESGAWSRQETPPYPRLQVRFDGKIADSAARPTGKSTGEVLLRNCGSRSIVGHDSMHLQHAQTWWVSPLPQAGTVEFTIFLPGAVKSSGSAQMDAGQITSAARQSEVLWEAPGTGRG